jgi:single-stranded DNA-binding protein
MADSNGAQPQQDQYAGKPRQPGTNIVIMGGNLTHDPVLSYPKDGPTAVATLRIAINGPLPRTPGRKQRVDYLRIDVWGANGPNGVNNSRPQAQMDYLRKGREITASGRLQIDHGYDDAGRINNTYVTLIADQVKWHNGNRSDLADPTDSVVVEGEGTPDTVAVEAEAPAEDKPKGRGKGKKAEPEAPAVEEDPVPLA